MPKLTMPKKSTAIDMTALCDFTLLLLTFFIMSSNFKPQEVVEVRTPASTSTKEIPMGFMQITVDKGGRIFFELDNYNLKRNTIEEINRSKNINLSEQEINAYVNGGAIGVPFTQLKSYLSMDASQQSALNKTVDGIPADTTGGGFTNNELAYWVQTVRYQANLLEMDPPRIVIKVDGDAPYNLTNKVVSTLGKLKIFRFSFITNAKSVPPGTALFEKQQSGATAPAEATN